MKKIILFVLTLGLLTGCSFKDMMNTPTKRVEELLGKYQSLDKKLVGQLDEVVSNEPTFNETHKKDYKDVIKKQYQNLTYKIKNETVDGNKATVEVQIEVVDLISEVDKANKYTMEHEKEFMGTDNKVSTEKVNDYKIKQLKDAKVKIKYTITFDVKKTDKTWKVADLNETQRQKLQGMYK